MADARPLLDTYSLYIDGRWVDPESGRYDDISPSTEATIAHAPDASLVEIAAALSDGATLAAGGRRPAGLDKGFYFEPTILTDVAPDARIAQEEVFGPVLSVLRYRDDDDAVAIANNSRYGLSGAVRTDVGRAVPVARRVRTGQIAVNGCIPGDAPFGGFKQSGLGREGGGLPGLHRYMEPKAIGIPA
jgi:aldehyde dehydrogenase (NAD+)